jgi:outer membrane immunogenic protein
MKSVLLAGSALLVVSAMATGASASDTGGYDWSGFYAGINAGMLIDNSNVNTGAKGSAAWTDSGKSSSSSDDLGFTGGGMLGYNWQIDHMVLGIETDINYGGLSGSGQTIFSDAAAPYDSMKITYDSNWFGTLRGRAGYAADNLLFYGTAGLAYGGFDTKTYIDGAKNGSSNVFGVGWTAGAGVEYGIDKWSLGLEYLYVDLGSQGYSMSDADFKLKNEVDYQFSVVRATAKYRF